MAHQEPETPRNIPIEWHIPDNILTRYATNMVIQQNGSEFIIMFFEIRPPLVFGTLEEQKAQLGKVESAQAECVGRIVVTPERMPEFAKAFLDSIEQHRVVFEKKG
jgi:hypothetical protein